MAATISGEISPCHDLPHQVQHFVVEDFAVFDGALERFLGVIISCLSGNFQQFVAGSVRIDSGWNCTPSTFSSRWRTPMISPSSVQAVTSRQAGRVSRSDRQRVVAHHGQRIGQAGEDALALVMHRRGLAVHQLLGMHDLAAEGRADALVAEADAEQGASCRRTP
jgi:hypothetical protein